jgi:DNA-directed RNA polymerase subunit M/transcription elongation factor TFIIS
MMLVFCSKCGNIMVLKIKDSDLGVFVCRNCSTVKKLRVRPIEIKEPVRYVAPPVPVLHY